MAGMVGGMLGVFLIVAVHYLNPEYEFRNPLPGRWARGGGPRPESEGIDILFVLTDYFSSPDFTWVFRLS